MTNGMNTTVKAKKKPNSNGGGKKQPKFKYRLRYYVNRLTGQNTLDELLRRLPSQITRGKLWNHMQIPFGSKTPISGDDLKIYAEFFTKELKQPISIEEMYCQLGDDEFLTGKK